ncbi:MAG: glycosyltransferase family 2 protein [Candidatus Udaeobacter sp.]
MSRIPRVSVVVTCYKRVNYLAEALRSIFAQSYDDYEILVADDSGTAAAREIVAGFAQPERITYLAHASTLGVASSIAHAVKQARGQFIAILNDDDSWEPQLLDKLVTALEANPRRVLATSDHWLMDANGNILQELSESWSVNFGRSELPEGVVSNPAEFVVSGGPAINLASVFRKEAVDWSLLVPKIGGAYDYWIGCLLAATGRPIYYTPERLGRWRIHEGMETARPAHDKRENLVYIYSALLKDEFFQELKPVLNAKRAETLFATGRDKLHFGRVREARLAFWQCFCRAGNPQALVRLVATFLPEPLRRRLKQAWGLLATGDRQGGKPPASQNLAARLSTGGHRAPAAK